MSHAIQASVHYVDADAIGTRSASQACLRQAAACAARTALAALGGCATCPAGDRSAIHRTWPDAPVDEETGANLRSAILMGHAMTG